MRAKLPLLSSEPDVSLFATEKAHAYNCYQILEMIAMSTITIRDIPEDAHAALKVMATDAQKGGRRSVEGFARSLLVDAARRRGPRLGSQLLAIGRQFHASVEAAGDGTTNEEIDALFKRSTEQGEPASFE